MITRSLKKELYVNTLRNGLVIKKLPFPAVHTVPRPGSHAIAFYLQACRQQFACAANLPAIGRNPLWSVLNAYARILWILIGLVQIHIGMFIDCLLFINSSGQKSEFHAC